MLKDLCMSVTLLFLVSLSVSCLFILSDCGMWYAPLFKRMQGTELAMPHSSCIWSGLCLEGQRFDRRNLLSSFRIQLQQFNALFYLHRHVRLFGMVSKARIVHSGLKSNFSLEVCKSPGVVIYSYVPTVVFLFVCLFVLDLSVVPILHQLVSQLQEPVIIRFTSFSFFEVPKFVNIHWQLYYPWGPDSIGNKIETDQFPHVKHSPYSLLVGLAYELNEILGMVFDLFHYTLVGRQFLLNIYK